MNPALQEAIKEAYASAPANQCILHTLEIRQRGIQARIFLVRSLREITATLEDGNQQLFEPSGFNFSLPVSDNQGFQSLNISIDNIGLRVSDFCNRAVEQRVTVEIVYRPYLSTDLSAPQMNPPLLLYLKDVKVTSVQVTGRATFMDIINKHFPSELYIRDRFPTL
jgi:hypothetical protein